MVLYGSWLEHCQGKDRFSYETLNSGKTGEHYWLRTEPLAGVDVVGVLSEVQGTSVKRQFKTPNDLKRHFCLTEVRLLKVK